MNGLVSCRVPQTYVTSSMVSVLGEGVGWAGVNTTPHLHLLLPHYFQEGGHEATH